MRGRLVAAASGRWWPAGAPPPPVPRKSSRTWPAWGPPTAIFKGFGYVTALYATCATAPYNNIAFGLTALYDTCATALYQVLYITCATTFGLTYATVLNDTCVTAPYVFLYLYAGRATLGSGRQSSLLSDIFGQFTPLIIAALYVYIFASFRWETHAASSWHASGYRCSL